MKTTQALIVCAIISISISCKCRQKTDTATTPATNETTTTSKVPIDKTAETTTSDSQTSSSTTKVQGDTHVPAVYRVAVSFISFGAGTDPDARPMLDKYVQQYMDATSKRIVYDAHPWGREGEIDICFELDNMTAEEEIQFIKGLRDIFKDRQLVRVEENKPNKYRK